VMRQRNQDDSLPGQTLLQGRRKRAALGLIRNDSRVDVSGIIRYKSKYFACNALPLLINKKTGDVPGFV
jgi:hypothetical protein